MGIDLRLQAIAEESALFQRAKENPIIYGHLQFFGTYLRLPSTQFVTVIKSQGQDADFHEFAVLLSEIEMQKPVWAERHVDIGRHWNILQVTLSSAYGAQDWIEQALDGGPALWSPEEAQTDYPLGFLSSPEVVKMAQHLGEMDLEQIGAQWNPDLLREAGGYKAHHLGAEDWNWVKQDLVNLRAFYAAASEHGEGVLSIYS